MSITVGRFLELVESWAASLDAVDKVLLAGSQAKKSASDYVAKDDDLDLVVFLKHNNDADKITQSLVALAITQGILIHPLVIQNKDVKMKSAIPEYRQMFLSAKTIYKS